jgi:hypothetical protein
MFALIGKKKGKDELLGNIKVAKNRKTTIIEISNRLKKKRLKAEELIGSFDNAILRPHFQAAFN